MTGQCDYLLSDLILTSRNICDFSTFCYLKRRDDKLTRNPDSAYARISTKFMIICNQTDSTRSYTKSNDEEAKL